MARYLIPGKMTRDLIDESVLEVHPSQPRILDLSPGSKDRIELDKLKAEIVFVGRVHTGLVISFKADRKGCWVWAGQRRLLAYRELLAEGHELPRLPYIMSNGNEVDHMLLAGTTETVAHDIVAQIRWVKSLINAECTHQRIVEARGKGESTGWVTERVAMMSCCEAVLQALGAGEITQAKAKQLAKLEPEDQRAKLQAIREAKAAGNGKAGTVAPKRPGVKLAKKVLDAVETAPHGLAAGQVQAFTDGVRWASGLMSAEDLAERYGVEL